jgi:hypothetical protein
VTGVRARAAFDFPFSATCCAVTRHSLANVGMGADEATVGAIAQRLSYLSLLMHLNLERNDLGAAGLAVLAPVLTALTCLKHIE